MKRLAIALASTLVALLVLDLVAGKLLIDAQGRYKGNPVPPFEVAASGKRLAFLERMLASPTMDAAETGLNAFDPELGWTNFPGPAKRGKVKIQINSIGARGAREYAPEPPPGVRRVVCYGESFTFGTDVEDDESWPFLLEAEDPSVEAINMGVGAYGTDQALLRSRRHGFFGARAATLGVMVENITRNVNRLRSLHHPESMTVVVKPRFVLEGQGLRLLPHGFATRRELYESALEGALHERLEQHEYWSKEGPLVPLSILRLLAAGPAAQRRDGAHMWRDPRGEPYQVMQRIVEAFVSEARAAGVEDVLVLVFPTRRDITEPEEPPAWQGFLDWMDARDIDRLDLTPVLLEASAPARKLFVTSHLGKLGNTLVARAVHERLFP